MSKGMIRTVMLLGLVCGVGAAGAGQPGPVGVFTWTGGGNTFSAPGVYGTQGVPAATNIPGARWGAVSWTDQDGNHWLFGGANDAWIHFGRLSSPPTAAFNDLWKFDPHTREWTWIAGSGTTNVAGVYGTMGIPAAGNAPGARFRATSWIDDEGNLWLFGGYGQDSAGTYAVLNDLWKFCPATGLWTWIGGSNTAGAASVRGPQGAPSADSVPGATWGAFGWMDHSHKLWLYDGTDLWKYNSHSGLWTWLGGPPNGNTAGSYGTQGVAAATNWPPLRNQASGWTDSAGTLWLFGGMANFVDNLTFNFYNDLWSFNPASGLWTWVSGDATTNGIGSMGTEGVAATSNAPGARFGAAAWADSAGNLWLFGGDGLNPHSSTITGELFQAELNDLWKLDPVAGLWTWAAGTEDLNGPGVYGTLGTPAATNVPPARDGAVAWLDEQGNFRFFGGEGRDSTGAISPLNDLWKFSQTAEQ